MTIRIAEDVGPDPPHQAGNRCGHTASLPQPRRTSVAEASAAPDDAIYSGRIDADLPCRARRCGSCGPVSSVGARRDRAVAGCFYELRYPQLANYKPMAINNAIRRSKPVPPDRDAGHARHAAATYPDNLGYNGLPGVSGVADGATSRRERRRDGQDDPVQPRHVPHVPQIGARACRCVPPDSHETTACGCSAIGSSRLTPDPGQNSAGSVMPATTAATATRRGAVTGLTTTRC